MKTLILIFIAIAGTSFANDSFQQLVDFNPNWKHYENRIVKEKTKEFTSEIEYVQEHLKHVLQILESNTTKHLSQFELQKRTHSIALLKDYRSLGNFPINYFRKERIPVFIDENGTHCAVGFLMQQTGFEYLAQHIALANNYAWVKEIQDTELLDWQAQYGFTVEELKLIQGAYDSYYPNALILPNRYEIPQKPDCATMYFEDELGNEMSKKSQNLWFSGQGKNGILNGKWTQNFAPGVPWILGYYDHGNRTGKWAEYYQGTNLLCRTEHWKDNKLNGVRTRFDRLGNVIEEIYFRDGNAITKINYDLDQSLIWVRTPIDSTLMETKLFSSNGNCIAKGREEVYNPDNLLWFQNIELTALNTAAITSRSVSVSGNGIFDRDIEFGGESSALYNQPKLVEYKKVGYWTYYSQQNTDFAQLKQSISIENESSLSNNYAYLMKSLWIASYLVRSHLDEMQNYESIEVKYDNDWPEEIVGFNTLNYLKLKINFYKEKEVEVPSFNPYLGRRLYGEFKSTRSTRMIKSIGQLNADGKKIGTWNYYDRQQVLKKTETFIVPEEDNFDEE